MDSTKNADWEHPIFFSMKDTTDKVIEKKVPRIDPETGKQTLRFLCACLYLNTHNKVDGFMLEHSTTIEGFVKEFSQEDVEFANVDDDDALSLLEQKQRQQSI